MFQGGKWFLTFIKTTSRIETILFLLWPAKSPNFHIFENLWEYVKNMLKCNPPKTKDQFMTILSEIWYTYPNSLIEKS